MRILKNIKWLLWNHGLITLFLGFNILPIATALTHKSAIVNYRGDLTFALLYQSIALFAVYWGYRIGRTRTVRTGSFDIKVGKLYFHIFSLLSLFGAYVAYANISIFASISDLQSMMIAGEDVTEIRAEAGAGGLSGILKMFGTMPLFVFLATSSLMLFCNYDKKSKKILLATLIISLLCVFIKVLFVFDRLSILALIIVFIYNYFFNNSISRILKIATIVLLLISVSFITLLRMSDAGIQEFLGAYFNLGVVNLEINIEHQQYFNYDFSQTFLQPLFFICKFFGLNFHTYGPESYCWNPAQSFWGFFFIDFNWLGLCLLPILGVGIKRIEMSKFYNINSLLLYFVLAYCAFSFTTIPIIRSMEFWLMLIVAYIASKWLVKIKY